MYINFMIFMISFMIGICFIYVSPVEYKTVVLYPTLDNLKKYQYIDSDKNCYQFVAKLVDCNTSSNVTKLIQTN